jgi:hypothetical protein
MSDNFDSLTIDKIKLGLNNTMIKYRNYQASEYLYDLLLQTHKKNKLNELLEDKEFYKLLYATLDSWNMNSRGAKLKDFDKFINNIKSNKAIFVELEKYNLSKMTLEELKKLIDDTIIKLYCNISILESRQTNENVKDPLVANSKLFHFILPNLCPPMDRKYTMDFFYDSIDTNVKKYKEVFLKNKEFLDKFNRNNEIQRKYVDKFNYTLYSTKILDNVIIGLKPKINKKI